MDLMGDGMRNRCDLGCSVRTVAIMQYLVVNVQFT